ncbi:MAG: alpha/beta hydrolase [Proteobacteria bacterium]|nr:alpha/beta hydrolase [Pseudomonadota bacterium]
MRFIKIIIFIIIALFVSRAVILYIVPDQVVEILLNLERKRCGLIKKEITLPDGIRYVYLEGGEGEPLMLLHGFGANKDNFTRIAKYLTPHYRVIAVDHAGFGESSHPEGADYSPPAQVDRLRRLAKALGIKKLHLGGSSMGGHIAMTWAAFYQDEISSLWLLAPGGVWSAPKTELNTIIQNTGRNPLMAENEDEFRQLFDHVMTDPPYVPQLFINVFAKERIKNFKLEGIIFRQLITDSVEKRVKGLETPTLIVWGEKDRVLHMGAADILDQLMPNAKVIVMKDTGHLPMLEAVRQTADDYLSFREEINAKTILN